MTYIAVAWAAESVASWAVAVQGYRKVKSAPTPKPLRSNFNLQLNKLKLSSVQLPPRTLPSKSLLLLLVVQQEICEPEAQVAPLEAPVAEESSGMATA